MVNLFLLAGDPKEAVAMYCDTHIVKMTSESCQILCTVLHHWGLWDAINDKGGDCSLWKPAYIKHPVVFWAQSSIQSAVQVCRYAQCLLDEYKARYGTEHLATTTVWVCCKVILRQIEKWLAMDDYDECRIRSKGLNKADLITLARAAHGDKYADDLAPKVFDYTCAGDLESQETGYHHAAVCAFALKIPGKSTAFNKQLTADLYACGARLRSVLLDDPDPNIQEGVRNMAGLMHGLYYACKIYIGFGAERKPLAWWGEVGRIPKYIATFLPELIVSVFVKNGIMPCVTGPERRLPTSKCLPFPADKVDDRPEMVSAFPDMTESDLDNASDDDDDDIDNSENAAPNPRKRPRSDAADA